MRLRTNDNGAWNAPCKTTDAIKPVLTTAYPTPAKRPLNSRMDTARLQKSFDLHLPEWQTGEARMLSEVLEKT